MRRLFSLTSLSSLIVLAIAAAAPGASAQPRLDVFVTPIPNAPFSGVINVERSTVQRDGTIVNLKTIRDIHRDSRGRIYNEMRMLLPVSNTGTPQVIGVLLFDPQTRTSTSLNPGERTFTKYTVNRPPETVPPALFDASSMASGLPQNQFTKEEDLGSREIAGVPAHGIRKVQAIRAEHDGAAKEIVVTDEYWYSEDLHINLLIKHNDPRTGSVTLTVTHVTRTEPDPALFEIPDGYKSARGVEAKQ